MTRPDKQWALVSKVFQLRLYLELNPFGALTCEIRLPQKEFLKFRVVLGEIPIYQAKEPLAVQGKELRPSPRYPKAYSAHDQERNSKQSVYACVCVSLICICSIYIYIYYIIS